MKKVFTSRQYKRGLSDSQWKAFNDLGFVRLGGSTIAPFMEQIKNEIAHYGVDFRKIDYAFHGTIRKFVSERLFCDIAAREYGSGIPIALRRCILINKKPLQIPSQESVIPWHQDIWEKFRFNPTITVWTALDKATPLNGCLRVVPRSHVIELSGTSRTGFLSPEQCEVVEHCCEWINLPAEPGESILLHNYLLHSTRHNQTHDCRRAISACYAPSEFMR